MRIKITDVDAECDDKCAILQSLREGNARRLRELRAHLRDSGSDFSFPAVSAQTRNDVKRWEDQGIELVTFRDDEYPALLREIADFPPLLFVRGSLRPLRAFCVSIVGARHADKDGIEIGTKLGAIAGAHGVTVVSGLALGVDGAAHRGCLSANNAATVAVLANGLDRCYPPAHRSLFEDILERGGAVISEYEPGTNAFPQAFLERNRIIAALSRLVVVVQAAGKSGTLRTAHAALEYGREIAAIPWSITNQRSEGCNRLIQQGAHLITNPSDMLLLLGIEYKQSDEVKHSVTAEQKKLLSLLERLGPISSDELSQSASFSQRDLMELEIAGLVGRTSTHHLYRKC